MKRLFIVFMMLVYIVAVIISSVGAFYHAYNGNGWFFVVAGILNIIAGLYAMWKRIETIQ